MNPHPFLVVLVRSIKFLTHLLTNQIKLNSNIQLKFFNLFLQGIQK